MFVRCSLVGDTRSPFSANPTLWRCSPSGATDLPASDRSDQSWSRQQRWLGVIRGSTKLQRRRLANVVVHAKAAVASIKRIWGCWENYTFTRIGGIKTMILGKKTGAENTPAGLGIVIHLQGTNIFSSCTFLHSLRQPPQHCRLKLLDCS